MNMNAWRHAAMSLVIVAFSVGVAFAIAVNALTGCLPSTQSPADAVTLAGEAAELQQCIEDAKAEDGGLAYYKGCAASVKRRYHDGGTE